MLAAAARVVSDYLLVKRLRQPSILALSPVYLPMRRHNNSFPYPPPPARFASLFNPHTSSTAFTFSRRSRHGYNSPGVVKCMELTNFYSPQNALVHKVGGKGEVYAAEASVGWGAAETGVQLKRAITSQQSHTSPDGTVAVDRVFAPKEILDGGRRQAGVLSGGVRFFDG